MARDITTTLTGDDDMTPAFRSAAKSADKTADSLDKLGRAQERMAAEATIAGARVTKAADAAARAEQRFGAASHQAQTAAARLRLEELNLADVQDRLARALDRVGDEAQDTADDVDDLGDRMSRMHSKHVELNVDLDRGWSLMRRFGDGVAGAAMHLVRAGALLTTFGAGVLWLTAGVVPAVAALAHLALAAVKLGASVAPAAAAIPALVAGLALVKATVVMSGPAMAKALDPVTRAWKDMEGPVGRLATRGLRDLANEFVRVNFPAIGGAMRAIARAENEVVVQVGKWVNSTSGQAAIRSILQGTVQFTEKLAQVLPGVVASFGDMVGRAAGPGFKELSKSGGYLDRLADGAKHLFDSVSGKDVQNAFGQIERVVDAVGRFGQKIQDAYEWLKKNEDKIRTWADALTIGAGVLLALSGQWIPAVLVGLGLLWHHWDDVKAATDRAIDAGKRINSEYGVTEKATGALSGVVSGLVGWYREYLAPAMSKLATYVMPLLRSAGDDLMSAFRSLSKDSEFWTGLLKILGGILIGVVIVAVVAVTNAIKFVTTIIRIASSYVHGFLGAFMDLHHGVESVAEGLKKWFRELPGKISNALGDVGKLLTGHGKSLITGLIDGAKDALSGVASWAGDLKDRVVGAVKSAFGIHSPSRVFAQLGGHMVDGLIHGIVSKNPTALITKVFGSTNAALRNMVSSGIIDAANLTGKALGVAGDLIGGALGGLGAGNLMPGLTPAESFIISHESGGRTTAKNPTSTAFGLGQLLIANRRHYGAILGVSPDTTNYTAQLQMFRLYVRDRYGTAENAAGFWKAHHWYDQGGIAARAGLMVKMTNQPERVLSPRQTVAFERLVRVQERGGPAGGGDYHFHFPNYVGTRSELQEEMLTMARTGAMRVVLRTAGAMP